MVTKRQALLTPSLTHISCYRCGHTHGMDVPDIPARQYIDNKGVTHMVVGATQYHVTTGT